MPEPERQHVRDHQYAYAAKNIFDMGQLSIAVVPLHDRSNAIFFPDYVPIEQISLQQPF
jgi:hypothetical protein